MTSTQSSAAFRDILVPHLPYADGTELDDGADLAALGLDSMGVVGLLVDLEDQLGLEISDDMLTEETFATVGSLWTTVADRLPPDDSDG